MAYTPTRLYGGTLTTTGGTTLMSAQGAGKTVIVKEILLSNITATPATVTIAIAGVTIMSGVSVPANSVTTVDMVQVLGATDTITGSASATTAINAMISGVVIG
jgi:hypothetical protein